MSKGKAVFWGIVCYAAFVAAIVSQSGWVLIPAACALGLGLGMLVAAVHNAYDKEQNKWL